ncbi:MAG: hypothetical protein A3B08_01760 [Candidatus Taylorbacteria bacterium RIFCSPLOWO2_01_FULL_43_44]|uniref:Tetratricopeptide repeat protein n=1 Tax=Candidatus Taylorbacteria bacterium RIFCSPHIGHO2_02_FULL_43_32b TaxID=1802306 RepID=A0A1G2MG66_9BACT|nr:MAG: hypothetical protein A2743_02580 [Candidatus Taylorbacteria bacterium RIFCSPHIGHO2_01_FULL_43_47]OHA22896.1 MAG: hypothetical protein A3C72_01630 [Candidatus Taylorbacteria bacterium RIFCSPHIGHO2_02_FULL_43_32b]OHA29859.1 MAG: hypothetical protein A3B08_01760 [Candidatus Taylorbacteria bacterium RIFCSPLOWO2_01_FULL_43_44]
MKKANTQRKNNLNMFEHTTPFEARLALFLESFKGTGHLSVDDIKDIVWNAHDNNLLSRMVFMITDDNPKVGLQKIMDILNEAWNNFPHRELNGLAPRDMVLRLADDQDFEAHSRRDFFDIFADRFPKETKLCPTRDNEWECQYPANIQGMREQLLEMNEPVSEMEDVSASVEMARGMLEPLRLIAARDYLDQEPFLFDAAVICSKAAFENGDTNAARKYLESAIEKAKTLFPSKFVQGKDILPWHFADNRPLLLLLGEYATFVESVEGPLSAIPHYEELIALNPNDNQGIRGFLATAYLKTNRLEELLVLDGKYPDDMVAELAVGALLAVYKLGNLESASKRIKKMRKHWAHVFQEILKTDHPKPELLSGRVRVGGDDEAWLYWEDQGTYWMATPGAREFIREHSVA